MSREVLALAWPVMLSMGLGTLFTLVDAFWVGRLGPTALAAVAPAQFAAWVLWAIGAILETGIPSLVARAVGARDPARARQAAAAGLQLAGFLGVVVALLARLLSSGVFRLVGGSPEVTALGSSYLNVLLWGSIAMFTFMACEATLRAAGDTRTPMYFTMGSLGLNFVLDPLFIFGWGPFPRWEITGAAVATVVSQFAAVLAYVAYFASGRGRIRPRANELRVAHPQVWTRILRIGLPGGLNAFLFTVVYVFLSNALARFGNVPLAVLGVGNRLESINYLIAHGFSVAASTLVGQYLGAGRPERAERAAWMSALYAAVFTGTVGAIFILFPARIFGIFSTDPDTLAEGVRFLRIIGLSQLWMGVDIAIYGAFVGAGSTVPPMAISAVISVLRIPLAYLVAFGMGGGVSGVWWMISVTAIVRGLLLAWWFRRGRWKEAKVW